MRLLFAVLATGVLSLVPGLALAQAFPSRPIQVIVPFAPGGPVDVLARAIGEGFRERTGQSFVIENRPGGNTSIGATACKNAEADGYTICLLTATTMSLNPFLYAKLAYGPKELQPVSNLVFAQQVLLVHKSVPGNTFAELVRYAKDNPDKLSFGSFGTGGDSHLVVEWLKSKSGLSTTHIPYAGAAPALVAFERADVQVLYPVATPVVVDRIRTGQAKGLLVAGGKRNPNLPDVPTFAEAGLPNFEYRTWFGVFAPSGTPRERVDRLAREIATSIRNPDFQEKYLLKAGYEPIGNTPEEFATYLEADQARGEELVRISGVRLTQ
jgi:tripartite-type tricarboxylate transporter receptor subunit TctC